MGIKEDLKSHKITLAEFYDCIGGWLLIEKTFTKDKFDRLWLWAKRRGGRQ